jgi:hypothetical protein
LTENLRLARLAASWRAWREPALIVEDLGFQQFLANTEKVRHGRHGLTHPHSSVVKHGPFFKDSRKRLMQSFRFCPNNSATGHAI